MRFKVHDLGRYDHWKLARREGLTLAQYLQRFERWEAEGAMRVSKRNADGSPRNFSAEFDPVGSDGAA